MRFVKDDQVEKGRRELLIALTHCLQGRNVEPQRLVDVRCMNSCTWFARQVRLKTVSQRLLNKRIAIREEQHPLRPRAPHEYVDEAHGGPSFASASRHHQQRPTVTRRKVFSDSADGLVLIPPVDDGIVDRCVEQRRAVITDELQPSQVVR